MSLYTRRWQGDAGRPALALHCMMGSGAPWGEIAARLDGRVALHATDLPGHGRSPAWAGGESFAETTLAGARPVLNELAGQSADGRVDLLGHSFGAVMALRLAVEAPERIRSLTLVEPVMFAALPPDARDPDGLLARLDVAWAAGDRGTATAAFLDYWDGPDPDRMAPIVRDQMLRQMEAVIDAMPDLYEDRGKILRAGGIESIAAPAMLISGGESAPVIADIAAALAARLADVGRATVPDAGHMAPLTHPDAVAGLIAVNLDRA